MKEEKIKNKNNIKNTIILGLVGLFYLLLAYLIKYDLNLYGACIIVTILFISCLIKILIDLIK